jgi:hypothetical protein
LFRDSSDKTAHGRGVGNVKSFGKNIHIMPLSDILRRGLQSLLIARTHGDAATFGGEGLGRGAADPLAGGSNESDSIFQA